MIGIEFYISLACVSGFGILVSIFGIVVLYRTCGDRLIICRRSGSVSPVVPANTPAVVVPSQNPHIVPYILNMATRLPSGESPSAASDVQTCCICLTREVKIAMIPCGHLSLCDSRECVTGANKKCPICREEVLNYIGIFRP